MTGTTINVVPQPDPANAPLNAVSAGAYEVSRVVKATAGVLYGLSGYNSGASQFLHLFDATSLPANGSAPQFMIQILGTANFSIDFGLLGMGFNKGIVVSNSTTGPLQTAGAADCWFNARYK